MPAGDDNPAAGGTPPRRLRVYNGGFLTQARVKRILALAGWEVSLGMPGPGDWVGVWGKSPTAHRGETVAAGRGVSVLHVEDAFLRSVLPGRAGEPPLGLLLDKTGLHFDSARPSDLETLLATHPLDDTALLDRARTAMARMAALRLSKYNAFNPALPHPLPGKPYVLVIDQTRGDASIEHAGASAATFREMLVEARADNPGMPVLVKTHPETSQGFRPGHYGPDDVAGTVELISDPIAPWTLLEGATAVYTVSSGLGFEAILTGHKPRVFGQPWYVGWGLTVDENPVPRRHRMLTRAQAFAAAMILYPTWYDPYRDRLCGIEDVIDALEAQARAWREDHRGYVASGMRLWKRPALARFYGRQKRLIYEDGPDRAVRKAWNSGRRLMVWAGRERDGHRDDAVETLRVEDGFLRSRGLGANLTPPLSLVTDDLGIYYDPTRDSRLERLIAASPGLPAHDRARAGRLRAAVAAAGLSKYNLGSPALPELPNGRRILVPGQVEDDASIRLGCGAVRTNLGLLLATRSANPDAVIVYKPHPDVEAGLRSGQVAQEKMRGLADAVAERADPAALIDAVDEVWTLTSLTGFEALLRGKAVTCLGVPFYAGWGLTRDLGDVPDRRGTDVDLDGLVHAALIAYPRYLDPVTGLAGPPEVAVERLASGEGLPRGPANRMLAKLQGLFASRAAWWR